MKSKRLLALLMALTMMLTLTGPVLTVADGEEQQGEPAACEHIWNEGEVTTEPTCQAEGVKTYTCTACGEMKTEPVAKAEHTLENGICTVCGEAEPASDPQTYGVTFTGLPEGVNVTILVYARRADEDYSEAEPLAYEAGLVPGEYHYIAAAEGYETAEDDFTVADRDVEIELALTAATDENELEGEKPVETEPEEKPEGETLPETEGAPDTKASPIATGWTSWDTKSYYTVEEFIAGLKTGYYHTYTLLTDIEVVMDAEYPNGIFNPSASGQQVIKGNGHKITVTGVDPNVSKPGCVFTATCANLMIYDMIIVGGGNASVGIHYAGPFINAGEFNNVQVTGCTDTAVIIDSGALSVRNTTIVGGVKVVSTYGPSNPAGFYGRAGNNIDYLYIDNIEGQPATVQIGYFSSSDSNSIYGSVFIKDPNDTVPPADPILETGQLLVYSGQFLQPVPFEYWADASVCTPEPDANGRYKVFPGWRVIYDMNGGTYEGSTEPIVTAVPKGRAADPLDSDPELEGSSFDGWYHDKVTFSYEHDFSSVITKHLTLYAKWSSPTPPYVSSASLNLADSIDINIFVDNVPDVSDNSGYYVKYSTKSSDLTNGTVARFTEQNHVGGQKYKFSAVASFPANRMTKPVYFQIYDGNDAPVGNLVTYCVQDYCRTVFTYAGDPELHDLCEGLLAYGHFAQDRFPGSSSDPVDVNLCADAIAAVNNFNWWGDGSLRPLYMFGFGFDYYTSEYSSVTASLSLESRTELNFYFYGYTAEELKDLIVTVGGAVRSDIRIEKTDVGGDTPKCRVKIKGLTTLDMCKMVSLMQSNYGTFVEYAPLQYAFLVFNREIESEMNVCRALYLYCGAAVRYFR